MAAPAIEIKGLAPLRRELKAIDKKWAGELTKVNKEAAEKVAGVARWNADAMGGVRAHASSAIRSYASGTQASIGVRPGGAHPEAGAAFWGAKRRSGWNARNLGSRPQFPPWVGANWKAGEAGQGPYAINDAVASEAPFILNEYADMIQRLAARAFPE